MDFEIIVLAARRTFVAPAASGHRIRRLGIAAETLSGSADGIAVGRAIDALAGSGGRSVSAVPARSASGRDGRVGQSAHFDRLDE